MSLRLTLLNIESQCSLSFLRNYEFVVHWSARLIMRPNYSPEL